MISELESLERIEKPTPNDLKRMSVLRRGNRGVKPKVARTRPEAPPLWEQMDKIHEKFVGKIEPWTILWCTKCGKNYHLIDGSPCLCGSEEAKLRYEKHIGGFKIGTKTR